MTMKIVEVFKRLGSDSRGVTALEYGLIAAVIAVVMVAGASQLGTNLKNVFSNVATYVP